MMLLLVRASVANQTLTHEYPFLLIITNPFKLQYERVAIEAWFQKQMNEIAVAIQTFGSNSSQARAMTERGILSPMTHMKMAHLNLIPNHMLRSMAQEYAKQY